MNFRGCSGEPNRALRSYHSGDTEDVSWLLGLLRIRYPAARLGAVGFSLGGNVLLKLLGERDDGGQGLVDAAAVISVPYDLAAGSAELERTRMGRVYTEYFLRSLRRKIAVKRAELAERVDIEAADAARTIREFDDRVTAPLNGFVDAMDYYARCSSVGFLRQVRVPTLMMHAEDDPFLPREAIPSTEVRANPHLSLELVPRGGHVGFLEGSPWAARFWADEAAAHFVAGTLEDGC
jgi:predicted alpha/beta-fold hydrolase